MRTIISNQKKERDILLSRPYLTRHTQYDEDEVNRLKIMLAVTKRSNKWLAEMLGKDQATISKWCTNTCQPDLETLIRISDLLKVDVNDLLNKECTKE